MAEIVFFKIVTLSNSILDNPIEGHAQQEEPMVGKMTIREDLDALMENLDKMTLQLEKLNKNVELVQTRVSHRVLLLAGLVEVEIQKREINRRRK